MYNDTIKVANKIITYDDLFEIFAKMQEKLVNYKKVNDSEKIKNQMLDYKYQNWTFRDIASSLHFIVNFYDDTEIKFDNYNNFISVFNNRLGEIKNLYVYFSLSYSVELEGQNPQYYNQHINMTIYESKMDIDVSLSSEDKKIDDIYELIKNIVLNAPEKYDEIIKKKNSIATIVTLATGFIPALIITTILIFVPTIRHIYANGYVVFPIINLLLALVIGGTIESSLLDKYYKNIVPEQKYIGYDSTNNKSIYKDDIDKYVTTSEILIGKNINNLDSRNQIKSCRDKYKKWIPYELGIMAFLSLIVLFLGEI